MADSGRAETIRRLTGGVLLALCVGLAIERAGAQQQALSAAPTSTSSPAPARTATGRRSGRTSRRWRARAAIRRTAWRAPTTIARSICRSRDAGEKITGDAWLGWYTTKDGGLTLADAAAARLSAGRLTSGPRLAPERLRAPARIRSSGRAPTACSTTAASSSTATKAAAAPSSWRASSTTTIRRASAANRSPISARRSCTASAGRCRLPVAGADTRGATPRARAARERDERRRERASAKSARTAGGPGRRRAERDRADWSTSRGWRSTSRAPARRCARSAGPAPVCRCRRFPAGASTWPTRSSTGPDESAGASCSAARPTAARRGARRESSAACRAPTSMMTASRRPRTSRGSRRASAAAAGSRASMPNADINNDCIVDALDLGLRRPRRRPARAETAAPLARRDARRRSPDGRPADRLAAVQRRRAARRHRHRSQHRRRRRVLGAHASSPLVNPFDQGTTRHRRSAPTPSRRMTFDGAGRAYLAWSARGYAAQRPDPVDGDARIVAVDVDRTARRGRRRRRSTTRRTGPSDHARRSPSRKASCNSSTTTCAKTSRSCSDRSSTSSRSSTARIAADPSHHRRAGRAGRSGGDARVHVVPALAVQAPGSCPDAQVIQQLEFSPPNLPLFRAGTSPFMGDYIDVGAGTAVRARTDRRGASTPRRAAAPVFHAIWTDNRDIRPPANGDWTDYTRAESAVRSARR